MSSITQRIPNLLAGISQQPDNRKRPGQVKDAVNVYPDFTLGMLKRPGSKFVSNLHGANLTDSAKWFHILRDEQEKYIAQYADNVFRVWSLIDGGVRVVDMGTNTGVPGTCDVATSKTKASDLKTALSLVQTRLGTLREKEDALAAATTGQNTTVTKLFSVSNTYTVDVEETLESGILENSSGQYLVKNNGTILTREALSVSVKKNAFNLTNTGSTTNIATTTLNGTGTGITVDITFAQIGSTSNYKINTVSINTNGTGYWDGEELSLDGYPDVTLAVTGVSKGSERTNQYPLIASQGYRIYELQQPVAATHTDAQLQTATTEYNDAKSHATNIGYDEAVADVETVTVIDSLTIENAGTGLTQNTYSDQATVATGTGSGLLVNLTVDATGVVTEATVSSASSIIGYYVQDQLIEFTGTFAGVQLKIQAAGKRAVYDAAVANCAITTVPSNAYLKDATADDLEFLTLNDYTFVLNKAKTVSMSTDPADESPSEIHDGFFYINTFDSNTHYSVILTYNDNDDVERTETFTVSTANNSHNDLEDVVSDLAQEINQAVAADTAAQHYESNNADFTATAVGPGVYLKRFTDTLTVTNSATTHSDGQVYNKATTGGTGTGLSVNLLVANGVVTKATIAQKGSGYTNGDVISVDDSFFTSTQLTYNVSTTTPEFSISVNGGTTANAIYGFTDSVPNTSFLPSQSVSGHVVKVINTTDVDIDDMYVQFETAALSENTVASSGVGSWVETIAPGLKKKLDPLTMPHQLVRQADGSFKYEPVTWIDRLVGDGTTNPLPTFVNQKISNLFFYRNRLGFLSNGNVIMSKAADYFNFFNTSAQVATDDDPIDISAVGTRPAFLNHALPTAVGLVLYGSSEQHILSTDSDLFSPKTVKISRLSSYETDEKIEPVSVGTSHAFVSKTPLYTRLFELLDINRDRPPLMNDDTVVVPELVPASVDSMAASSALSLISLGTKGTNDLYQFRFLSAARDKRQLSTWYKWKTTTKVLHQFFDANTFYVIGNTDSEGVIESYDMSQSSEEGFLTIPTGEKTDVCLDLFYVNPHRELVDTLEIVDSDLTAADGIYGGQSVNANNEEIIYQYRISNNKITQAWILKNEGWTESPDVRFKLRQNTHTRVYLPYTHIADKKLTAIVLGQQGSVLYPSAITPDWSGHAAGISPKLDFFDLPGDYRGIDTIIGYNYDMELTLPKLYVYQQDGESVRNDPESNLILHRLRVQTGLSGPVDYEIKIDGLNDYTHTASVTMPYEYEIGEVNMQANATHVVPIHQRNNNLNITIKGTTPFPVSLLGFDWEGKYNSRFYRRI